MTDDQRQTTTKTMMLASDLGGIRTRCLTAEDRVMRLHEHEGGDRHHAAVKLLGETIRIAHDAEYVQRQSVAIARRHGVTWEQVGQMFGTSKQAAQQRFGDHVDAVNGSPRTARQRSAEGPG